MENDTNSKGCWAKSSNGVSCKLCHFPGGGALIKCADASCKRYYHLDCAYKEGGVFLEAEGNALVFRCNQHFKPITFCTCKKTYDRTKSMVGCDLCGEWFHHKCVGLTEEITAGQDYKYMCTNCITVKARKDSKAIAQIENITKKENEKKDLKSDKQQNALNALVPLIDIRQFICPLVEEIRREVDDDRANRFPIVNGKDIFNFESLVYARKRLEVLLDTGSSMQVDDEEKNVLERFVSSSPLLQEWLEEIEIHEQAFLNWMKRAEKILKTKLDAIRQSASLKPDSLNDLATLLEETIIAANDLRVSSMAIWCGQSDIDVLETMVDTLKWINDCINTLKGSGESPDEKLASLITLNRGSAPRVAKLKRHLEHLVVKCEFPSRCLQCLQEWAKLISAQSAMMKEWCNDCSKLVSGKRIASLAEVKNMMSQAKEFPITFGIYKDLSAAARDADEVEEKVSALLAAETSVMTLDRVQSLVDMKARVRIVIPCAEALDALMVSLENLSTYNETMELSRIPRDEVGALIEAFNSTKSHTAISPALVESMNVAVSALQAMDDSLAPLLPTAHEVIKSTANILLYTAPPVLIALRECRIISKEEIVLDFLVDADALLVKARAILAERGTQDFSECHAVLLAIRKLLCIDSSKPLDLPSPHARIKKATMHDCYSQLSDLLQKPTEAWRALARLCIEISAGNTEREDEDDCDCVCIDYLQSKQRECEQCGFIDSEQISCVQDLVSRGEALMEVVRTRLPALTDLSDAEECAKLYREMRLLPVQREVAMQLELRQSIFICIKECSALEETHSGDAMRRVSTEEMRAFSSLQMTVNKLSKRCQSPPNSTLLAPSLQIFPLLYWKAKVAQGLLASSTSRATLQHAEAWLSDGEALAGASSSTHWASLQSALRTSRAFENEARNELAKIHRAREESNSVLHTASDGDLLQGFAEFCRVLGVSEDEGIQGVFDKIILEEAEQALSNPVLLNKLRVASDVIRVILSSREILTLIARARTQSSNDVLDFGGIPESDRKVSHRQLIDIAALITSTCARLDALYDEGGTTEFLLATRLHTQLSQLVAQVDSWQQRAQALQPQISTRKALKHQKETMKVVKTNVLHALLLEPIAQMFSMPLYSNMMSYLHSAREYNLALQQLLLPDPSTTETYTDEELTALLSNKDDFEPLVFEELKNTGIIYSRFEAVPLDMVEKVVCNWAKTMYSWLLVVPGTEPDPRTMKTALEQQESAKGVVVNLSEQTREALESIGLITGVRGGFPVYNPRAHVLLRQSKKVYVNLEEKIDATADLDDKIRTALGRSPRVLAEIQELTKALLETKHLVTPDESLKKALIKVAHSKEPDRVQVAAANKQIKSEAPKQPRVYREDDFDDESEEGEDEDDQDAENDWDVPADSGRSAGQNGGEKRVREPKSKGVKRERESKQASVVSSASSMGKIAKKTRLGAVARFPKCAAADCNLSVNSAEDSYCSHRCANSSCPELLASMLQLRNVLAQNTSLTSKLSDQPDADQAAYEPTPSTPLLPIVLSDISAFVVKGLGDAAIPRGAKLALADELMEYCMKVPTQTPKELEEEKAKGVVRPVGLEGLVASLPTAAKELHSFFSITRLNAFNSSVAQQNRQPLSSEDFTIVRQPVRLKLENLLIASLARNYSVTSATAHGSILALEIEDEMFAKFQVAATKGAKEEFNKKAYMTYFRMLSSNLKKYNDHLVRIAYAAALQD